MDGSGKSCEFEVAWTATTDTTVTVKDTHGCWLSQRPQQPNTAPFVVTDLCVGNSVKQYDAKTKTLTFAPGVDLTTYLVPG